VRFDGMLAAMAEYDPVRFTAARGALGEYLKQESPETWRVLEDPSIGFSYTPEALVFHFLSEYKDVFERISMAPSLEILKRAAKAAQHNITLKCGAEEILIEAS
jgi:hypothetical protein